VLVDATATSRAPTETAVAAVVAAAADTGFFFFDCEVSTTGGSGETDWETAVGCFFDCVGGIIYYFMITYIIICLYNFSICNIKNKTY
jgi:hypothetical protein